MGPEFDHARLVAKIHRQWCCLSDEQRALGEAWYPSAYALISAMVPTPGYGGSLRACGVVAALSPRMTWEENLSAAARMLETARVFGSILPAVNTIPNRLKAYRIAKGEAPLDVLSGNKTRAFYRNLIGNERAVTIDVWAMRVAGLERNSLTDRQYQRVCAAYREVAREAGTQPRTLQAATWISIRGASE